MTITFSCEHCGKEIKAPDDSAGKRGKCPYCGQGNYIPDPSASDEEIPLAPLDEQEEAQRRKEIEDLRRQEKVILTEDLNAPASSEAGDEVSPEALYHLVSGYCVAMSNSDLDKAENYVQRLKKHRYTGLQAVEDFQTGKALDPAVDSIPGKLLQGFLKQLREQVR